MPLIYSNSADGYIYTIESPGGAGFSGARDDNTGDVKSTTLTGGNAAFTAVYRFGSRGGTPPYRVHRSFAFFDTSGVTGTVASAQFEIYGYSSGGSAGTTGSIIAVKSNAFGGDGGTALALADFDAIPGWTDGASQAGNVTNYSAQFVTGDGWSTSSANVLTGTSDLKADMQNNNIVIVCFMNYTNDYLNVDPSSASSLTIGGYYNDASSASLRPRINYNLVATGYANTINGVTAANIGKVNGVATADISKINGI